ncbi:MAG: protein-L-isoaspartate(D-aspartate) O-methyltransferase [Phycisphaerae bacterium]|nr:protein-L-isoaspartate(D-aspartate) O-methyltransferase [Phycisphaerae bacterium]
MTALCRVICRASITRVVHCGPVVILLLLSAACRESATNAGDPNLPPPRKTTTLPATTLPTATGPVAARRAPPHARERQAERDRMVATQIAERGVRDPRVLAAMRDVPRHWFVPETYARQAYDDNPLPIGYDQTISQPYIVAVMTELLALKPGEKVLEIGTGSGYQAAVLAELTDEVYTIEIVEPLAKRTIELFNQKGYRTIHARIGDGYRGWPEEAPFDAIIVTCAPDKPPAPLVEQLAVGGRMCIPVNAEWGDQELIVLQKRPDGTLERRRVEWVRFVPMTGEAQDHDK